MRFAEVEGALPAVSVTQGLVEGGANQQAATFGRGGLGRAQRVLGRRPRLRLDVLFALLHAQVQGAVFVHLDEHILRARRL